MAYNIIRHRSNFPNRQVYTVNLQNERHFHVTVTSNAASVTRWLGQTLFLLPRPLHDPTLVVGLGVQWTHGTPSADIIQLCIGCRCLIFQLSLADRVPNRLRRFLYHPLHTFVGFWNHTDRWKLERSVHRLHLLREPVDLRHPAGDLWDENLRYASMRDIVWSVLGYDVTQRQGIGMSDWSAEHLDMDQIASAAIKAFCARLIGVRVRDSAMQ
ncbi:uncharacterized protein [Cicer arietinum]|uniref:Uncharacterized protein LOC101513725 n=1 Tax=Cicer arietinum TaxID=3827 RepID=A0A1S2XDG1_CICAR|nr:uncharacterized protein LOC101513725 [Cicer arietinum]